MKYTSAQIAKVVYELNKAFCEINDDFSQSSWEDAAGWQRSSTIAGVMSRLEKPDMTAADQHQAWLDFKLKDGWKYGPVKDANKKEHPCMVAYNELPIDQQLKDELFGSVVDILKKA